MNELMEKANKLYAEALKLKDIARKSDNNLNKFLDAKLKYTEAINVLKELKSKLESSKINSLTQINSLIEYYGYEAKECEYAFEFKNGNFEKALEIAKEAQDCINVGIKVLNENLPLVNPETLKWVEQQKKDWTLCQMTVKLKVNEPKAKAAFKNKDYVVAMDAFNKQNEIHDEIYKYVESQDLDQVHKRIEFGNYFAGKASVAMARAGVYDAQKKEANYQKEILEEFLVALECIKKAAKVNPEWIKYKEGINTTERNIKKVLSENKHEWLKYIVEFGENKDLNIIMMEIDNNLYKREKAKIEIEKKPIQKFLLTSGLWVGVFVIVAFTLLQFAESSISWYRFIAIVFSLPLSFIILSAFILKSNDNLKEENFMKLISLAVKINFSGLKAILDDSKNHPKKD